MIFPRILRTLVLSVFGALIFALAACHIFFSESAAESPKEETKIMEKKNVTEAAVVHTTLGSMTIEFWPDVAPATVENFKKLAKSGFYNGTCFHRIIRGFMIQGGDPKTKNPALESQWGTGGPGYTIKAEFNKRQHVRGVISMARAADPNSAGSQFFICHGDARFLDGQYTAFGKVTKGDDVLEKIASVPCVLSGSGRERSKPTLRVEITGIEIVPAES